MPPCNAVAFAGGRKIEYFLLIFVATGENMEVSSVRSRERETDHSRVSWNDTAHAFFSIIDHHLGGRDETREGSVTIKCLKKFHAGTHVL